MCKKPAMNFDHMGANIHTQTLSSQLMNKKKYHSYKLGKNMHFIEYIHVYFVLNILNILNTTQNWWLIKTYFLHKNFLKTRKMQKYIETKIAALTFSSIILMLGLLLITLHSLIFRPLHIYFIVNFSRIFFVYKQNDATIPDIQVNYFNGISAISLKTKPKNCFFQLN